MAAAATTRGKPEACKRATGGKPGRGERHEK
jgi:hypothetical protein